MARTIIILLSNIKRPYSSQVLLVHRLIFDALSTSHRLYQLAECLLMRHFRHFP